MSLLPRTNRLLLLTMLVVSLTAFTGCSQPGSVASPPIPSLSLQGPLLTPARQNSRLKWPPTPRQTSQKDLETGSNSTP